MSLDENSIRAWAKNWRRPRGNGRGRGVRRQELNKTKSEISTEILVSFAKKAIIRFPDLNFEDCTSPDYASVDRIDPLGGYELSNIEVVPMWFNAAKMQMSESELFERIKKIYERLIK